MQYRTIEHYEDEYEVNAMCDLLGISRAVYYKWRKKHGQPDPDAEHLAVVQDVYETSHKTYGYRRITIHLQDKDGRQINHKAGLRLMQKLGIRSVARKPTPTVRCRRWGPFTATRMS